VFREIRQAMPQYDYLYLGDNARAPYGPRSFELVYEFTLQAVRHLFEQGCPLVVLACNTASAKALRTIQQRDLPRLFPPTAAETDGLPTRRVLGVIRPTVEAVGDITLTRHIGVLATQGTIRSQTYELELAKLHPDITVTGEACPMWVPLVENYEYDSPGADYFVKKNIDNLFQKDPLIDTIILGCTHFPLLFNNVRAHTPAHVQLMPQGTYVANSLQDYLRRHPEMDVRLTRGATARFLTTEQPSNFNDSAAIFLDYPISAQHITLS
jgi:glutamate racemase